MSTKCGIIAVICALALVGGLSDAHSVAANVACEYLEEGQPVPVQCEKERAEEEAFFKRVERERQEEKERKEAEEREEQERERKEEREQKARERREKREAREWAVKPKVTQKIAHQHAMSLLHKKVPTWTYRTAGSLECAGGKINRSHWRCRVSWIAGSVCHGGRLQVIGAGHINGQAIYRSKIEYQNGYGYIRHGRIRCFLSSEES